jgi:hypothetical protein
MNPLHEQVNEAASLFAVPVTYAIKMPEAMTLHFAPVVQSQVP